jgi:hypothetical protein
VLVLLLGEGRRLVPDPGFDVELVRSLAPPERSNKITYDSGKDAIRGFGLRITANGVKSFILNYTIAGRERRITIGAYPAWSVVATASVSRPRSSSIMSVRVRFVSGAVYGVEVAECHGVSR